MELHSIEDSSNVIGTAEIIKFDNKIIKLDVRLCEQDMHESRVIEHRCLSRQRSQRSIVMNIILIIIYSVIFTLFCLVESFFKF